MSMTEAEAVEGLAKLIHESGREAVEQRKIYRDDVPVKPFCEYEELHETAKEGRRMMARYIRNRLVEVVHYMVGDKEFTQAK